MCLSPFDGLYFILGSSYLGVRKSYLLVANKGFGHSENLNWAPGTWRKYFEE